MWGGSYNLGGNGRVYPKFLDKPFPEGNVDPSVHDYGGDLYVGQDFNINPMASVIAVRAVDECHVLDCLLVSTSNTPEVCAEIQTRYPNRRVIFCPTPPATRGTRTRRLGRPTSRSSAASGLRSAPPARTRPWSTA